MTPARRLNSGPGALAVLALIFVASAASRGIEGGEAFWLATQEILASRAEASASDGTDPTGLDDELPEVLAALAAREAELDRREASLDERERALEVAEAEIRTNLAALQAAEAALEQTIALADGAAQRDLERLTRMYETMKPKEAAALFEAMDPNFAAGFLAQMAPGSAAQILEGLRPETAYLLSTVMAGRNMAVPTR